MAMTNGQKVTDLSEIVASYDRDGTLAETCRAMAPHISQFYIEMSEEYWRYWQDSSYSANFDEATLAKAVKKMARYIQCRVEGFQSREWLGGLLKYYHRGAGWLFLTRRGPAHALARDPAGDSCVPIAGCPANQACP